MWYFECMFMELIDNPTRKAITLALKKRGSLSVEELSKVVRITPMGVRQHLLVLERNGIVEYITKRRGVGRPGYLYRLTEKAGGLFPNGYADFSLDILKDIEKYEGREKVDELFRRRTERIVSEKIKTFSEKSVLSQRVSALAEMLSSEGGIVELEEDDKDFKLKQFNCPLPKVASRFREACACDFRLLQALVGEGVPIQQQQTLADGALHCLYLIPKET